MKLYIDIETLPCDDESFIKPLYAEAIEKAEQEKASVTAPANYKDADKIAAYIETKRQQIDAAINPSVLEKVAKTSFDGLYGQIACICYAFDDGKVFSVDRNTSGDEKTMIEHFYTHVFDMSGVDHHSGTTYQTITVVGHNVAGFDLPFLKHRSIINGVLPVPSILKAMSAKPWDACIADTMLMWSSDSQKRVSMDKLCKAFGLDGKGDFDGSMVADTWPIDPQKVIDYCKDDVRRTRSIFKRLTWDQPDDLAMKEAA